MDGNLEATIEVDVFLENYGSIWLIRPISPRAQKWLDENISPDHQTFSGAVVCEPRYLEPIATAMAVEGLVLR